MRVTLGVLAAVAGVLDWSFAGACTTSDGSKIQEWMKSCDSISRGSQAKCDNKACHIALHRLIEEETAACYAELGLGSASALAKYKPLDDFCHGEGPDPAPIAPPSTPTAPAMTTVSPTPGPVPTTASPTPTRTISTPPPSLPINSRPTSTPPTPSVSEVTSETPSEGPVETATSTPRTTGGATTSALNSSSLEGSNDRHNGGSSDGEIEAPGPSENSPTTISTTEAPVPSANSAASDSSAISLFVAILFAVVASS